MRYCNLLTLFLVFFLTACQTFPPTLDKTRVLQITVIDENTQKPLEGFKVKIGKNYAYKFYWPVLSTALLAEYTSDDKGEVSAPISLKGDYSLEAFGQINSENFYGRQRLDTRIEKNNKVILNVKKSWRKEL